MVLHSVCSGLRAGSIHSAQTVGLCLAGFVSAIRITSLLDMGMLRNTCAFCQDFLHKPT